ncbi:hypothetical protein [Alicyclobacillus mali (ex Roth et al. 2021)]|uniref:hypothetical protein n=1 Tax=Alicyclobacillus mali (ex Roth et al. 2021) TaxID=1123961 RepID=UPI001F5DDFF4|nr:hypothetical protein [Alicyclobacillus mali (ex Roth et al. 2021)]
MLRRKGEFGFGRQVRLRVISIGARNRGFSLLWSMVLVVILATIVSSLLIWSRYTLRVGGMTQIQDSQRGLINGANLEAAALNAVNSVSAQASVPIPVSQLLNSTVTGVTTSQLQDILTSTVFPALQKQGLTVESYSLYTIPASTVLQKQLSQVQSVLLGAVNSLMVISQGLTSDLLSFPPNIAGAISAFTASVPAFENVVFLSLVYLALSLVVSQTSGIQIPHAVVDVVNPNGNTVVLDISYSFQAYGPVPMTLTPAGLLSLLSQIIPQLPQIPGINSSELQNWVSGIQKTIGPFLTSPQVAIPTPDWALQVAVV